MKRCHNHNLLKTYRKRLGLSQGEVAYLLGGVSGTKVSRYERGRRLPPIATALAFEALLGASVRTLYEAAFHEVEKEISARAASLIERIREETPTRSRDYKLAQLLTLRERVASLHDDTCH